MREHESSQAWIIGVVVVVVLAAVAYWYLSADKAKELAPPVVEEPAPEAEPEPLPEVAAPPPAEPAPVTEPERGPPPPLNESDEAALKDLMSLAPDGALAKWLVPDEVVRKWVAAVNAGSRGELIHKHRPLKTIKGPIIVAEDGATGMVLSPDNYHRYDQPVRLFALMDTDAAVALYRYWYPRLAQAYGELGIRNKNFHQEMLETIDQVLAAPEVDGPIKLVRPSVYYKFADPKLEKLPGLHKLMIRMGPDNAARVKEKLGELKTQLEQIPVQENNQDSAD
ncbi:Protein of unknown function [Microbulbifer donghaiensis]|uniref:DUF3014 domain-containing protein n=1 Tax=Microbulbifer donghaiensis TaxID=494016 RepID=A0A1M5FD95_9GAMM|nr:DUF3014 domain-containing protein [Microbulbifer donghaiensis]SHF89102.1 Protein of unknown function [Microbulbifer donghaiensis]